MGRVVCDARAAPAVLGVHRTHYLDLPAAALDTLPAAEINARIGDCLDVIAPDTLFVPFVGDIHLDHQIAFTSAMVWARPRHAGAPARVLAYETRRSAERRVGKECVSPCKSRGSPDH